MRGEGDWVVFQVLWKSISFFLISKKDFNELFKFKKGSNKIATNVT